MTDQLKKTSGQLLLARTNDFRGGKAVRFGKPEKNAVWRYGPVILFKKFSTPDHFGRESRSRQRNPIVTQKKGVFDILAFNTINRVTHP